MVNSTYAPHAAKIKDRFKLVSKIDQAKPGAFAATTHEAFRVLDELSAEKQVQSIPYASFFTQNEKKKGKETNESPKQTEYKIHPPPGQKTQNNSKSVKGNEKSPKKGILKNRGSPNNGKNYRENLRVNFDSESEIDSPPPERKEKRYPFNTYYSQQIGRAHVWTPVTL